MDSFARCKDIAISLSQGLPESKVAYGLYFPITPNSVWDNRWKVEGNTFIHFWVEYRERIIDAALEQYGEPPIVLVELNDLRYVKVGYYENDQPVPITDDPRIDWGSYVGDPNKPIRGSWSKIDEHLERINTLRGKRGH